MDKSRIVGFIEVLIPITAYNIKCEYCYVIQRHRRSMIIPKLSHTPEEIGHALRPDRFNGIMYISLCGAGETMLTPNLAEIVKELVTRGHIVNITTNGTISKAFERLISIVPEKYHCRINISFSYHYLELKRTNLSEVFWKNIKKVKDTGMSFVLQLNLYDGYEKYLEEIKRESIKNVGAYPQLAATRNEIDLEHKHTLMTSKTYLEYKELGNQFKSPLFEFTMKNFMKKQTEFCYAGKWSFVLNLGSGIIKPCYQSIFHINIFQNPDKQIKFSPVGKNCVAPFCMNSSHFISLGNIPSQKCPSYADLRNRKCREGKEWYNPFFKKMLSRKFNDGNPLKFSIKEQLIIWLKGFINSLAFKTSELLPKSLIIKIKSKYK